jgi:hypothetical protein
MEYEKPQYSMSFDDDQGQIHTAETSDLNALTKKVLSSLTPQSAPVIEPYPECYVQLPGGLVADDGEVLQDAEVQELTGEHEELLAKARQAPNPAKFISTLLQCGVVSIGDVKATPAILDGMLQGDLDMLILGIRRATFGEDFELNGLECPHCGEANDLQLNLSDIPVRKLEDPEQREYVVDLRKGRKARITLPTGALQTELFKKPLTIPEMNTVTLAHCILSFVDATGNETPCNGLNDVKKLGLADRRAVQDFIYNINPGPRYDEVSGSCPSCEGELTIPLSVGALFRGI